MKGVEGKDIFKILFVLNFIDLKNISQLVNSGFGLELGSKKDVYYSFLKSPNIDWRKILYNIASQFVSISNKKGDVFIKKSPQCFIIDDSLLPITGKVIEAIGKLFDHCSHKIVAINMN